MMRVEHDCTSKVILFFIYAYKTPCFHSSVVDRAYTDLVACMCDALYHIACTLTQYLYESFILQKNIIYFFFVRNTHAIVCLTRHHSTRQQFIFFHFSRLSFRFSRAFQQNDCVSVPFFDFHSFHQQFLITSNREQNKTCC